MFTTLLGALPRPPLARGASAEAVLDAVIAAQVDTGIELLTDGGWPVGPDPVAAWRATSGRTDLPVKAVLPGPFTAGVPTAGSIEGLRTTIAALAEAGCPWIEIAEPAAGTIGTDAAARARFLDLHGRLLDGAPDVHCSLAITGGAAHAAGAETMLTPPYASLALDLIAGPDDWHLIRAASRQRGIVCGVVAPVDGSDDSPEILVWAASYAASGGRGLDRVGLATASSLADLPWAVALTKLRRLRAAADILALPVEEGLRRLDPRALDIRSAAMGRYAPPSKGRGPRGSDPG